jgi:hypothetical protein
MLRTLTAPGNAEDPVVGGRQGPVRSGPYAAVVLVELLEPEEPDDEPEPEPDPESEEVEELVEDDPEDLAAGELLDEEPRLSLR